MIFSVSPPVQSTTPVHYSSPVIVDGPIVVFSLFCVLSLFLKDESFGESVKVITYCFYLGIAEWLHSLSASYKIFQLYSCLEH